MKLSQSQLEALANVVKEKREEVVRKRAEKEFAEKKMEDELKQLSATLVNAMNGVKDAIKELKVTSKNMGLEVEEPTVVYRENRWNKTHINTSTEKTCYSVLRKMRIEALVEKYSKNTNCDHYAIRNELLLHTIDASTVEELMTKLGLEKK